MFLEQYKLEANPFAADAARPVFASHSMRYAALKLEELIGKNIQSLFLSGPPGVGKGTLTRQRFRQLPDLTCAWIKPNCDTPEHLLAQLLAELGPGPVEGSAFELHRILEVFLRHQAGNGQFAYIAADGLERFAAPVLRELEALAQLRLHHRPVVYILALTRSEELVTDLIPQYDGGSFARAAHQRLSGFTLDETRAYVWACLRGAGCDWAQELVPEEALLDIQAFTQGIVGDINAICCAALGAIAVRSTGSNRQPKITRTLLKEAGASLNLRYEASGWTQPVEELSAGAVHFRDPSALRLEAARLIVSSGKTVVTEVTLNRPRIVLGRDDSCDISLDSRYVSRFQSLFMETPEGWLLIDHSSTNGCFVNGRRVYEHRLRDGDLIAVGHHHMRFAGPNARNRPGATDPLAAESETTLVAPRPDALRSSRR